MLFGTSPFPRKSSEGWPPQFGYLVGDVINQGRMLRQLDIIGDVFSFLWILNNVESRFVRAFPFGFRWISVVHVPCRVAVMYNVCCNGITKGCATVSRKWESIMYRRMSGSLSEYRIAYIPTSSFRSKIRYTDTEKNYALTAERII